MQYCVVDTERIKGSKIYLLSYLVYDENYRLVESKTFIDDTIDLSNRKSPKTKVKMLWNKATIVHGFSEIYNIFKKIVADKLLIVFSNTDTKAIQTNCKELNIEYNKTVAIDLQKALFDLSNSEKHKCNLKDYCIANNIAHSPHIPESDCFASFELYKNLVNAYGIEFVNRYKKLL